MKLRIPTAADLKDYNRQQSLKSPSLHELLEHMSATPTDKLTAAPPYGLGVSFQSRTCATDDGKHIHKLLDNVKR